MRSHAAWLALAMLCSGCAVDSELGARYDLEREYWEARQLELDAYAGYPRDSYVNWRYAVDAYRGVLLSNPSKIPESRGWSADVVSDMERVSLAAEIGLLRLDALDYRFHATVTHPAAPAGADRVTFGRVPLDRVTALYDSLGTDLSGERCARRLRAVVDDPLLWEGTSLLRDSLLAVPALLSQRGEVARVFAESFYSRIIATWPDSAAAALARDYRARVRIAAGDFDGALEDITRAITGHPDGGRRGELRLLRCDVLAFSLDRGDEAIAGLRAIVAADPGAEAAWHARVRLGLLDPPAAGSEEQLRRLHMDERCPPEAAASALYARATEVERRGDREGAEALWWRLTQRFPESTPALAAPLLMIRARLRAGDTSGAESVLRRASSYYSDLIRRDSAGLDPRFLVMDCLLEAYLLLGRPEGAMAALEGATADVGEGPRVVAWWKMASVSHYLLGHPEKSVEILQKTLVQFPRSRYSTCVRWKLQRTREARDGVSG